MKNIINYYYNLMPDNIHQKQKLYYFSYKNNHYIMNPYDGDLELLSTLYNFHLFLLNNGLYVHQIVLNQEGNIATTIDSVVYVLLQINEQFKINTNNKNQMHLQIINFSPFMNFILNPLISNKSGIDFSVLKRDNIKDLWIKKNDYFEYQINQLGKKYPLILESFNYYIGLGETAIQLINTISLNEIPLSVAHRRIEKQQELLSLYNPLNLIIDSRARDTSEYFKTIFFQTNTNYYNQIINKILIFLKSSHFNQSEFIIFLARLIYPTYYFDIFENAIIGKFNEKELKKIIDKVNDYESILKNVYYYYKTFLKIEIIEWLE